MRQGRLEFTRAGPGAFWMTEHDALGEPMDTRAGSAVASHRASGVSSRCVLALFVATALLSTHTSAQCPAPETMLKQIAAIDHGETARVTRLSAEIPVPMYRQAVSKLGRPVVEREGKGAFGVVIVAIPVESLWVAINDEDHHDMPGDYFTVGLSEVVAGPPRGESRVLFQYYEQWGIGRWWAIRMTMNRELYDRTHGALWELWWQIALDEVNTDQPPIRDVAERLNPILDSRGSWLFAAISENCTLIESYSWVDAGGALEAFQKLMAKRTVRASLSGLTRMAEAHASVPHDGAPFVRPDGTTLGEPPDPSFPPGSPERDADR